MCVEYACARKLDTFCKCNSGSPSKSMRIRYLKSENLNRSIRIKYLTSERPSRLMSTKYSTHQNPRRSGHEVLAT